MSIAKPLDQYYIFHFGISGPEVAYAFKRINSNDTLFTGTGSEFGSGLTSGPDSLEAMAEAIIECVRSISNTDFDLMTLQSVTCSPLNDLDITP